MVLYRTRAGGGGVRTALRHLTVLDSWITLFVSFFWGSRMVPLEEMILRTKLSPPRPRRLMLARPRVDALLREALDHRVTIVRASTGYGKTTALAGLADLHIPLFWYSASEGDGDSQQFLAHLIAAFRIGLPSLPETPFARLPQVGDAIKTTDALLNALDHSLTAPAFLVIDDYHLAASKDVNSLFNHFLSFLPRDLHLIVSTRHTPEWDSLVSWRAFGEVLEIRHDRLAFTCDEIAALFREKYGVALSPRDARLLEEKTEGWPIVLQLIWQGMQAQPRAEIASILGHSSKSLDTLFAYLTRNVLAQQSPEIQQFLLQTSVLRDLDPAACAAVCQTTDCRPRLAHLQERDLFIVPLGDDHYRYHHLFHDFLREQAERQDGAGVRERHRRAAEFYCRVGQDDEAMYHLLRTGAFDRAVELIGAIGENVLRAGRLDTLASWIDAIPSEKVAAHPLLIFYLGDLARLRSRYDDALAWYVQAEQAWRAGNDRAGTARALRGQALVYLDTVRPSRAEALLEEALRLLDGLPDRVVRARLLELLAENKLNMGKAEEAERLTAQAHTLREEGPGEDALSVRVKLRTGRLDQALQILETWAREERGQIHPPRAHRETLLILSLIHSMQGHAEEAFAAAQEAITLAGTLHSPYILAGGKFRLGHAYQIRGDLIAAMRCYEEGIALADQIAVQRPRAEACLGMARAHGYRGDLESARRAAEEGIEIARTEGDAWMVALLQLAWGASTLVARRYRQAIEILDDALAAFRSCGDTFGETTARLWLALGYWHSQQRERSLSHLDEALALAQTHRYDYLLTTRTLFGPQDARLFAPLLLETRRRNLYAASLLAAMGLEKAVVHPGYQLRVQTLGTFRLWRGETEVTDKWRRHKARELLQLFITHRGRTLERDEILELLWGRGTPAAAARDFKVALSVLNRVLEPEREGEAEPAFIAREDSAYGLRAGADIWIDADEFTRRLARADELPVGVDAALDQYRRALALYQDDYLAADARYADWASAERERLLTLYLRAADRLAEGLLSRGQTDECIAWCERILARDRCWERAYRLLMRAYAQRGDRAQVRRAFDQCALALREDLDAAPSPETEQEAREMTDNQQPARD